MTETHATVPPEAPVFPPGRYGRRREAGRRPLTGRLVAAALIGVLVLAAWQLYEKYGDPKYDPQLITYTDITDNQVQVVFRVAVPPGGSATCLLRARDHDGAEVGHDEVTVTAPRRQTHVTVQHRVATTARPFIGEVLRCRPA
ncbi:DUF4307 domain-containing protein [Micromonospora siamensis]|uniref:DUF4307 domain-containing protein n=1 Tax=Micromonospora siamensis TaxID=299152 RepID=A0A1C5HEA3_9ACTN|nr:DUF4307 domain-containing protein [Micromonospora siamensis]SCG44314.1 protein of unknown function [Micromonospora siamensis]